MKKGKRSVLRGVIKDTGILCSCTSCKGRNVVSPFYFEVHAGSHKKRPSDYIFLESGNTLHDVLRACTDATLDTLESAILGAIGPVPEKRTLTCQVCKSSFKTFRTGKFASFCDTCLESKEAQNTTRSPRIGWPRKNLSPGTKTTSAGSPTSSYGAKTTRAGSPTSYGRVPRNFYPVAKTTTSAASPTSSGRVPKNFSPGSKATSAGRITRKGRGLHKLVFMSGILPEGTDVGCYVGGKRLLDGYIKELGIYCHCCNTVVSPSQFEGHAGRAARRKPRSGRDNQDLGYFQALFACIERLLSSLKVKHFVLPAADEAVSIWTQRFGFGKITQDELLEHLKGGRPTVFHGTSTLHKPVPVEVEAEAWGPEEEEAPVPGLGVRSYS